MPRNSTTPETVRPSVPMARESRAVKVLAGLVADFLDHRIAFLPFHHAFIEQFVRLPPGAIARKDRAKWKQAYGRVLSSIPAEENELRAALAGIAGHGTSPARHSRTEGTER